MPGELKSIMEVLKREKHVRKDKVDSVDALADPYLHHGPTIALHYRHFTRRYWPCYVSVEASL